MTSPRRYPPHAEENHKAPRNVRYWPKADMSLCAAPVRSWGVKQSAATHVRFTPNSDRESGHQHTIMSALPPKADMCSALADVCFGPKADIGPSYSITASARASTDGGIVRPNVF